MQSPNLSYELARIRIERLNQQYAEYVPNRHSRFQVRTFIADMMNRARGAKTSARPVHLEPEGLHART